MHKKFKLLTILFIGVIQVNSISVAMMTVVSKTGPTVSKIAGSLTPGMVAAYQNYMGLHSLPVTQSLNSTVLSPLKIQQRDLTTLTSSESTSSEMKRLLNLMNKKNLLHWASALDDEQGVKLIIKNGADVNAKDNNGVTALMDAAVFNSLYAAVQLIDAGADINAKDYEGLTPLMHAVNHDSLGVARYLVYIGGADVKAKDNFGRTALDRAKSSEMRSLLHG